MAIGGSNNGEQWVELEARNGTSYNLTSHRSALIRQLIFAKGHRVVFRAPYYPVDGPIEYVFNTIQQELRMRVHTISTENDLVAAIQAIIANIPDFVNYFAHCGY
jgi:transposase